MGSREAIADAEADAASIDIGASLANAIDLDSQRCRSPSGAV
jgi:hypothetical protein